MVDAIVARDRKATARFVSLHTDAVYRYVWRRLAPRVDMVDDIVQDVFVAAWRSLRSYSGSSSLEVWLMGVAKNKVEDYYRRTLSHHLDQLESDGDFPITDNTDLDRELDAGRQVERAAGVLMELPVEYAAALRWRYWEGRSARDMAGACGRTEKAVERVLARARERFRIEWLKGEGGS